MTKFNIWQPIKTTIIITTTTTTTGNNKIQYFSNNQLKKTTITTTTTTTTIENDKVQYLSNNQDAFQLTESGESAKLVVVIVFDFIVVDNVNIINYLY